MPKIDAKTWNKLMVLGKKKGSMLLSDLAHEMELSAEDTITFIQEVFPAGVGARISQKDDQVWIELDADSIQYMLPLSAGEWTHLYHMMDSAPLKEFENDAFHSLKAKLSAEGPVKVVMDIMKHLEVWDQELSTDEQMVVKFLDDAVLAKEIVKISTHDGKAYDLFPCRVLHLDGNLSLIAEDSRDHCLMVIPLRDVAEASANQTHRTPKVQPFEVEEFISAIRAMSEKETRLILKIINHEAVNLFPDHHFLGKPCMITNSNGDLIWAAYIEPCEALFDWVYSLGRNVEILDPTKFKEQYFMYCEDKLRKIA